MTKIAPYEQFQPLALGPERRVFVLTGAGVSQESGIPTFRDADGLWEGHSIEDVATPQAWSRNPELVWQFYSARRAAGRDCQPNAGHRALETMQERVGQLYLCTQNVDRLHELAGSRKVVHVHGELYRSCCSDPDCPTPGFDDEGIYDTLQSVPRCDCGARIRPDIVWFGEMPKHLPDIARALGGLDLFLAVGTSGVVYPAAGFVQEASLRSPGVKTVYVGPEPPDNAHFFDEVRLGPSGAALPQMIPPQTA